MWLGLGLHSMSNSSNTSTINSGNGSNVDTRLFMRHVLASTFKTVCSQ
jgi:hypothetical protein